MATSFAALKTSGDSSLKNLTEELSKLNPTNNTPQGDDRIWKPTVDKAGNGYAVVRFLPASAGEEARRTRLCIQGSA